MSGLFLKTLYVTTHIFFDICFIIILLVGMILQLKKKLG